MKKLNTKKLVLAAVVAAMYTVLSYFGNIFGITYGGMQCRFSEALTVLPFFFPWTAWGLFAGCILTNILSPMGIADLVFGSLATLIAGLCTARVKNKLLAPVPPVIANGVIIGAMIAYFEAGGFNSKFPEAFALNGALVAAGEIIACCFLGSLILVVVPKIKFLRDMVPEERLNN